MNKNDYEFSCSLDVHRWSEHKEVNKFGDYIYKAYLKKKSSIRKKHLKVILLDFYVAWRDDPTSSIGIGMSPKNYKAVRADIIIFISNIQWLISLKKIKRVSLKDYLVIKEHQQQLDMSHIYEAS